MALKIGQAARSIPGLLRDPFDLPKEIDLYDGLADLPPVAWAYRRMVAGLPAAEREELRRLTEERVDWGELRALPEASFGRHYLGFMDRHGYVEDYYLLASPGSVDAFGNHWTMLRFARIHDYHHTVLGLSGDADDEAALQVFNTVNFGEPWGWATLPALPVLALRYGRPLRMARRVAACAQAGLRLPELFTFPFERRFDTPLAVLRSELGIPPDGLFGDWPA